MSEVTEAEAIVSLEDQERFLLVMPEDAAFAAFIKYVGEWSTTSVLPYGWFNTYHCQRNDTKTVFLFYNKNVWDLRDNHLKPSHGAQYYLAITLDQRSSIYTNPGFECLKDADVEPWIKVEAFFFDEVKYTKHDSKTGVRNKLYSFASLLTTLSPEQDLPASVSKWLEDHPNHQDVIYLSSSSSFLQELFTASHSAPDSLWGNIDIHRSSVVNRVVFNAKEQLNLQPLTKSREGRAVVFSTVLQYNERSLLHIAFEWHSPFHIQVKARKDNFSPDIYNFPVLLNKEGKTEHTDPSKESSSWIYPIDIHYYHIKAELALVATWMALINGWTNLSDLTTCLTRQYLQNNTVITPDHEEHYELTPLDFFSAETPEAEEREAEEEEEMAVTFSRPLVLIQSSSQPATIDIPDSSPWWNMWYYSMGAYLTYEDELQREFTHALYSVPIGDQPAKIQLVCSVVDPIYHAQMNAPVLKHWNLASSFDNAAEEQLVEIWRRVDALWVEADSHPYFLLPFVDLSRVSNNPKEHVRFVACWLMACTKDKTKIVAEEKNTFPKNVPSSLINQVRSFYAVLKLTFPVGLEERLPQNAERKYYPHTLKETSYHFVQINIKSISAVLARLDNTYQNIPVEYNIHSSTVVRRPPSHWMPFTSTMQNRPKFHDTASGWRHRLTLALKPKETIPKKPFVFPLLDLPADNQLKSVIEQEVSAWRMVPSFPKGLAVFEMFLPVCIAFYDPTFRRATAKLLRLVFLLASLPPVEPVQWSQLYGRLRLLQVFNWRMSLLVYLPVWLRCVYSIAHYHWSNSQRVSQGDTLSQIVQNKAEKAAGALKNPSFLNTVLTRLYYISQNLQLHRMIPKSTKTWISSSAPDQLHPMWQTDYMAKRIDAVDKSLVMQSLSVSFQSRFPQDVYSAFTNNRPFVTLNGTSYDVFQVDKELNKVRQCIREQRCVVLQQCFVYRWITDMGLHNNKGWDVLENSLALAKRNQRLPAAEEVKSTSRTQVTKINDEMKQWRKQTSNFVPSVYVEEPICLSIEEIFILIKRDENSSLRFFQRLNTYCLLQTPMFPFFDKLLPKRPFNPENVIAPPVSLAKYLNETFITENMQKPSPRTLGIYAIIDTNRYNLTSLTQEQVAHADVLFRTLAAKLLVYTICERESAAVQQFGELNDTSAIVDEGYGALMEKEPEYLYRWIDLIHIFVNHQGCNVTTDSKHLDIKNNDWKEVIANFKFYYQWSWLLEEQQRIAELKVVNVPTFGFGHEHELLRENPYKFEAFQSFQRYRGFQVMQHQLAVLQWSSQWQSFISNTNRAQKIQAEAPKLLLKLKASEPSVLPKPTVQTALHLPEDWDTTLGSRLIEFHCSLLYWRSIVIKFNQSNTLLGLYAQDYCKLVTWIIKQLDKIKQILRKRLEEETMLASAFFAIDCGRRAIRALQLAVQALGLDLEFIQELKPEHQPVPQAIDPEESLQKYISLLHGEIQFDADQCWSGLCNNEIRQPHSGLLSRAFWYELESQGAVTAFDRFQNEHDNYVEDVLWLPQAHSYTHLETIHFIADEPIYIKNLQHNTSKFQLNVDLVPYSSASEEKEALVEHQEQLEQQVCALHNDRDKLLLLLQNPPSATFVASYTAITTSNKSPFNSKTTYLRCLQPLPLYQYQAIQPALKRYLNLELPTATVAPYQSTITFFQKRLKLNLQKEPEYRTLYANSVLNMLSELNLLKVNVDVLSDTNYKSLMQLYENLLEDLKDTEQKFGDELAQQIFTQYSETLYFFLYYFYTSYVPTRMAWKARKKIMKVNKDFAPTSTDPLTWFHPNLEFWDASIVDQLWFWQLILHRLREGEAAAASVPKQDLNVTQELLNNFEKDEAQREEDLLHQFMQQEQQPDPAAAHFASLYISKMRRDLMDSDVPYSSLLLLQACDFQVLETSMAKQKNVMNIVYCVQAIARFATRMSQQAEKKNKTSKARNREDVSTALQELNNSIQEQSKKLYSRSWNRACFAMVNDLQGLDYSRYEAFKSFLNNQKQPATEEEKKVDTTEEQESEDEEEEEKSSSEEDDEEAEEEDEDEEDNDNVAEEDVDEEVDSRFDSHRMVNMFDSCIIYSPPSDSSNASQYVEQQPMLYPEIDLVHSTDYEDYNFLVEDHLAINSPQKDDVEFVEGGWTSTQIKAFIAALRQDTTLPLYYRHQVLAYENRIKALEQLEFLLNELRPMIGIHFSNSKRSSTNKELYKALLEIETYGKRVFTMWIWLECIATRPRLAQHSPVLPAEFAPAYKQFMKIYDGAEHATDEGHQLEMRALVLQCQQHLLLDAIEIMKNTKDILQQWTQQVETDIFIHGEETFPELDFSMKKDATIARLQLVENVHKYTRIVFDTFVNTVMTTSEQGSAAALKTDGKPFTRYVEPILYSIDLTTPVPWQDSSPVMDWTSFPITFNIDPKFISENIKDKHLTLQQIDGWQLWRVYTQAIESPSDEALYEKCCIDICWNHGLHPKPAASFYKKQFLRYLLERRTSLGSAMLKHLNSLPKETLVQQYDVFENSVSTQEDKLSSSRLSTLMLDTQDLYEERVSDKKKKQTGKQEDEEKEVEEKSEEVDEEVYSEDEDEDFEPSEEEDDEEEEQEDSNDDEEMKETSSLQVEEKDETSAAKRAAEEPSSPNASKKPRLGSILLHPRLGTMLKNRTQLISTLPLLHLNIVPNFDVRLSKWALYTLRFLQVYFLLPQTQVWFRVRRLALSVKNLPQTILHQILQSLIEEQELLYMLLGVLGLTWSRDTFSVAEEQRWSTFFELARVKLFDVYQQHRSSNMSLLQTYIESQSVNLLQDWQPPQENKVDFTLFTVDYLSLYQQPLDTTGCSGSQVVRACTNIKIWTDQSPFQPYSPVITTLASERFFVNLDCRFLMSTTQNEMRQLFNRAQPDPHRHPAYLFQPTPAETSFLHMHSTNAAIPSWQTWLLYYSYNKKK